MSIIDIKHSLNYTAFEVKGLCGATLEANRITKNNITNNDIRVDLGLICTKSPGDGTPCDLYIPGTLPECPSCLLKICEKLIRENPGVLRRTLLDGERFSGR